MNKLLFLGNLGAGEIFVIALVVLLLFGGKKIPELMKGLGKGIRSFKEGRSRTPIRRRNRRFRPLGRRSLPIGRTRTGPLPCRRNGRSVSADSPGDGGRAIFRRRRTPCTECGRRNAPFLRRERELVVECNQLLT